jgi:hypothetical protein
MRKDSGQFIILSLINRARRMHLYQVYECVTAEPGTEERLEEEIFISFGDVLFDCFGPDTYGFDGDFLGDYVEYRRDALEQMTESDAVCAARKRRTPPPQLILRLAKIALEARKKADKERGSRGRKRDDD